MTFSILILTIGNDEEAISKWIFEYKNRFPSTYIISKNEFGEEDETLKSEIKKILNDPSSYTPDKGLGPVIILDKQLNDVQEWMNYKRLGSTLLLAKILEKAPKQEESEWENYQKHKDFIPYIFNMIL